MTFEQCPKCNKWMVTYERNHSFMYGGRKKCYNQKCDYEEPYCDERWLAEHDILPALVGKKKVPFCRKPKGFRMCDDCELRK